MKRDFYKTDSEILKYNRVKGNTEKELKKKLLYLTICSNENYQRRLNEFDNGIVKLTLSGLSDDLYKFSAKKYKLSKSIISTYLNELVEDGLLEVIQKGSNDKNSASFYYVTTYKKNRTDRQTDFRTDIRTDKTSNYNGLDNTNKTDIRPEIETEKWNSKKEFNKKNNKKEIYSAPSEALWKLYPHKKNKAKAMLKIPKLISEYGYEQINKCIKRYIEYVESERKNGFSNLNFQGGDRFFGSTYLDYLDENYQEQLKDRHTQDMNKFKIDRSIKADSVEDAIKLIRGEVDE